MISHERFPEIHDANAMRFCNFHSSLRIYAARLHGIKAECTDPAEQSAILCPIVIYETLNHVMGNQTVCWTA